MVVERSRSAAGVSLAGVLPDVPARPPGDPCRDGRVVLGPLRIERAHGTPEVASFTFDTERAASACLLVRNGDARPRRVSSADLALDDVVTLGPQRFNQHVARIEQRVELSAGAHELTARVRSAPGAFLEVEIRIVEDRAPEEIDSLSQLAQMRYLHCTETNFRASQLTPEERERALEASRTLGYPVGRMIVNPGPYGVPNALVPVPWEEEPIEGTQTERALRWLELHRAVFMAVDERIAFVARDEQPDGETDSLVVVDQLWQGVLVAGGIEVRLDAAGHVTDVSGTIVPSRHLPDDVEPALDADAAAAAARAALDEPSSTPAVAGLFVMTRPLWGADAGTDLMYYVSVRPAGTPPWEVWLDATDGSLVAASPEVDPDHEARARVFRPVDPVCEDVGGVLTAVAGTEEIVYRHSPPGTEIACPDASCEAVVAAIDDVDHMFLGIEMFGWSDRGIPPVVDPISGAVVRERVPGNQPYVVLDEWPAEGGASWSPMEWRVYLPPEDRSRDVIAHEFGHGAHQIHRRNVPFDPRFVFGRGLGESLSDEVALAVQDHAGAVTLRLDDASGDPIRDYNIRECTGYEPTDECDFHPVVPRASVCPPDVGAPPAGGCLEYTHMNQFPDERLEEEVARTRIERHRLGCVLTRPFAMALDRARDGDFHHGIQVRTLPERAPAEWLRFVLRRTSPATDLDLYQHQLWASVGKLGGLCAIRADAPPCSPAVDEMSAAMSAFWANGHWSPILYPGTMRPDYETSTGIAAAVAEGLLPPEVWLFFGDPDGDLRLARLQNPTGIDMAYPPTVPVLTDRGEAVIAGDPAATATTSGQIVVAWRDRDTSHLRVAAGTLATFLTETRFPDVEIEGSPGIVALGSDLHVAFRPAGGTTIEVWRARVGDTTAELIATVDQPLAHDPFLVAAPAFVPGGETFLLLTAEGPAPICDTVLTTTCRDGHRIVVRRWLGTELSSEASLLRMALPLGLGGSLDDPNQEPVGPPIFARTGESGPAAVEFGDRIHVVFQNESSFEFSTGIATYASFRTGFPIEAGSESRAMGRGIGGRGRLAPVLFNDPSVGEALLVYGNSGGTVVMSYKRSF